MKDLFLEIRKKRKQVEKLRGMVAKLDQAEKDLEALERTAKLLVDGDDEAPIQGKRPRIRSGSSLEVAKEILREAGRPMHADELVKEFVSRGQDVKKGSLVSTILKNIKKADHPTFEKVKPNTFKLVNGIVPISDSYMPADQPQDARERSA